MNNVENNEKDMQRLVFILITVLCYACGGYETSNDEADNYFVAEDTVQKEQTVTEKPVALIDRVDYILSDKTAKDPNTQSFIIDPLLHNTIVGKNGTIIIIPANAIVGQFGMALSDLITINLIEAFSSQDFMLSKLNTSTKEQSIASNGAVYISATDEFGYELEFAKDKYIRVQMPHNKHIAKSALYSSKRGSDEYINRTSRVNPSTTAVLYPISYVSKNYSNSCPDDFGITTDTINKPWNLYGKVIDFEKTILATLEFRERYQYGCTDSIVNIYIDNLNKDLWESDLKVVEYLKRDSARIISQYFKQNKSKNEVKTIKKSKVNQINKFYEFSKQKIKHIDTLLLVDTGSVKSLKHNYISFDITAYCWYSYDYPVTGTNSNIAELTVNIDYDNGILFLLGKEMIITDFAVLDSKQHQFVLPLQEEFSIVFINKENGKYNFATKKITLNNSDTISMSAKSCTKSFLVEELSAIR